MKLCFVMVACLALGERAGANEERNFSFIEAVQYAVEHSPSFAIAHGKSRLRELARENAFSVFMPQLDLSATHGVRGSRPNEPSSPWAGELSLTLSENLYDNGASLTAYRSARLQEEIAELSYRDQRDATILSVATEFMKLSLAVRMGEVQEQRYQNIAKLYRTVESQYQQGVKTRRDYLRFKSEMRRAEIELETARFSIERSRLELLKILGLDSALEGRRVTFAPLQVEVDSVATVPTKAPQLTDHYRYRIAALQSRVFENEVSLARRKLWPELFATAGATYRTGDYLGTSSLLAGSETTSWSALLTVKFNLLDWGIRRRDISIAEIKRAQSETGLAEKLRGFASENAKLMLDLRQSATQFTLSKELLELETTSYGALEIEYRNGKVHYLDIIYALRELLSAKAQLYSSYFELKTELLKYRYHEGRLYESLLEK